MNTMQYAKLGNSGLIVSRLALGTMTFNLGSEFIPGVANVGQKDANTLVSVALDHGVNFFDTANGYSSGESETALGIALGNKRKENIVCTKIGFRQSERITHSGLSRGAILEEVEGCLKRLNTDYLDVLVVHKTDFTTPLEETLSTLDDVVRQGKARYLGFSNWPAWMGARAIEIQRANGWTKFVTGQYLYNPACRDLEIEVLPMMDAMGGVSLMAWSPLAGGLLSGKYDPKNIGNDGRLASGDFIGVNPDQAVLLLEVLETIAKNHSTTTATIAIAWSLAKRKNSSVLIGASKEAHLTSALDATGIKLSDEEIKNIDACIPERRIYPKWFDDMMTDELHSAALK